MATHSSQLALDKQNMEKPTALPSSSEHLRYLDGLRGIAILMVLMVHSSQLVAGLSSPMRDMTFYGVRGVQLFFIVSGLTLALNYMGKPFHAVNFASRRFFRIAPMFYFGAVLYLVLSRTTSIPLSTDAAAAIDIVATFLFLHGWLPSAINTVVPGGWSIAAEAMFYLIFPFLLVVSDRPRVFAALVVGSYLLAAAMNFVLRRLLNMNSGGGFPFEFWLVHLPAFAGGCWLAIILHKWKPKPWAARLTLYIVVVCILVDSQLRGFSNLLVAILLLTLLVWSCSISRPRILEGRILPLIGQISFSLYILHFAVLALLRPLAEATESEIGPLSALFVTFVATLLLAGGLSFCTWKWIELPVIRRTRHLGLPRPTSASRPP